MVAHRSGSESTPRPCALVVHGFTGNPSSVRTLAEAFADEGFHVEAPRLPGHGTTVEDMLTSGWGEWSAATEDAYQRLALRAGAIVVAGLSMGAAVTLGIALRHLEIVGIVCINPATQPWPWDVREALDQVLAEGLEVLPAVGSDIADPDAAENSYAGAPVRPLISFLDEGLTPMAARYGELRMPLLLFTSRHDHVVEPSHSEHLAATYGGSVVHRWLELSYHVATMDFDRDIINVEAAAFARGVTGG